MSRKAFVFLYADMDLGGIQKYIYNYLSFFNKNNIDTYWIAPNKTVVDKGFKEEILKVNIIRGKINDQVRDKLSSYDNVVALTFSVLQFEKMKKLVGDIANIRLFYVIPHFKNPELHPEDFFATKVCKKMIRKWVRSFYQDYLSSNQLFFINEKHGLALREHYDLPLDSVKEHVCKKVREIPEYDEPVIEKKLNNDEFNIITVSRFEFPHKGYVLGLLDIFPEIVSKCPKAKLIIIGYGEGEPEVNRKIDFMPKDISDRITVIGRVSYVELQEYYSNAHLSIGVAGSASDAATFAVPTLVARHYCEECEVYGQFADFSHKRLSEEPGNNVMPYIEQVYAMENQEYIDLCRKTYNTVEQILNSDFDPLWMFKVEQREPVNHSIFKVGTIKFRAFLWVWINRFKMLISNPGFFIEKVKSKLK